MDINPYQQRTKKDFAVLYASLKKVGYQRKKCYVNMDTALASKDTWKCVTLVESVHIRYLFSGIIKSLVSRNSRGSHALR